MLHPRLRRIAVAVLFLTSACSGSRIRTETSLTELQAAALRDSADAIAHYNLAIGYWAESNFPAAREALLSAVRVDPRFAEAYLALAYLPYAERPDLWIEQFDGRVPPEWEGPLLESEQHYSRAFMINPLMDMRILGAVTPVAGRGPIYDAWFRGFDDYRNGDYAAAFGRYSRLIRDLEIEWRRDARSRMPDAILLHRGLAAAHLGNWEVAVGDLRIVYDRHVALEEDEDELIQVPLETNNYRYILAVLLEGAGNAQEAEAMYREAASENLGLYMAHVRLANLAESRGDVDLAVTERRLAVETNPEDPTVHLEQGLTFANARMLPQAIASLENAIRLNPLDAQAHYFLGVVHGMAGEQSAAREAFRRFLSVAPARMAQERAEAEARLATAR